LPCCPLATVVTFKWSLSEVTDYVACIHRRKAKGVKGQHCRPVWPKTPYLRERAGLSQVELAHLVFDRGNISEWENRKVCPSLLMLETLATGFKISISELMKGI
jgi:DNA-binding XRE family transcriptional regulator